MAVQQRTKSDCGIAAVANATGESYKTVKVAYGPCHGIDRWGMDFLLGCFGKWKFTQRSPKAKDQNIEEWARKHPVGRFVVSLDVFIDSHAVAVVDGVIHGHYSLKWPVEYFFRKMDG